MCYKKLLLPNLLWVCCQEFDIACMAQSNQKTNAKTAVGEAQ